MTAVPLLSGIVANGPEFARSYPVNLEPVPTENGISRGQLRAAPGAVEIGTGPGTDRGGIEWNNVCYRVMGTDLVTVSPDGTVTTIGEVGGSGPARLDYSFDRLGIRSGDELWFYDGSALAQVTDVDLGPVVDMIWIDNFWMTTDGANVVVTELGDPTSVNPLKYGSSEEDPDPVTGLMKAGGEAHVLNRHTIQVFRNIGGNGFPFQTVKGATIPYGCVSATAKCAYAATFAFVGSARGEALRVYVAGQATATPLSTRELEDALAAETDPAGIILESRASRGEQRLLVHLAAETWIYCAEASAKLEQPIWYRARSGTGGAYRIRNAVQAYGMTIVGDADSTRVGRLSDEVDTHFGEGVEWEFDCGLVYGGGRAGIVHTLELVGLPGRGAGTIAMSMTRDGLTWSIERTLAVALGERRKRLQWRPHSRFTNYMGLKFRGIGGMAGFARCEAGITALG